MKPRRGCANALSRRGFLRLGGAGAAMTVADWRLWAAEEGLPGYYGEHLAKVAARIKALSAKCDDGFFFITDLHIPSNRCVSGRILAKLIAENSPTKTLASCRRANAVTGASLLRIISLFQPFDSSGHFAGGLHPFTPWCVYSEGMYM